MGVIEEIKAALVEQVRLNIELRKQVALETQRADDYDLSYSMLLAKFRDAQSKVFRHSMLLRQALRTYAWHTHYCLGEAENRQTCTCGFSEWANAVGNEFDGTTEEELPFSEPPHD